MAILEIENLSKIYRTGFLGRPTRALNGIDLAIENNEIFGYLGPNGAGKTTTIKTILGIIRPTTGIIKMFGKPFSQTELKQNIGYMPENPYFYSYLSAAEMLDFYAQLFEMPKSDRRERAAKLLEIVGISHSKKQLLRSFSKGMLQRIGLAQALINDPSLVILDEPMSGLDPIGRKEVRDIILDLHEQGKTIFFSSHILSDVEMICDRVAIVLNGKIIRIGILEEMLASTVDTVEITVKGLPQTGFDELLAHWYKMIYSSDKTLIKVDSEEEIYTAVDIVKKHKAKVISIIPNKASLEDLFMQQVREVKKNES